MNMISLLFDLLRPNQLRMYLTMLSSRDFNVTIGIVKLHKKKLNLDMTIILIASTLATMGNIEALIFSKFCKREPITSLTWDWFALLSRLKSWPNTDIYQICQFWEFLFPVWQHWYFQFCLPCTNYYQLYDRAKWHISYVWLAYPNNWENVQFWYPS